MPPGRKAQKRKQKEKEKKEREKNNNTSNSSTSSSNVTSPNPSSPKFNGNGHEEISTIDEEIRAEQETEKEKKAMEEEKVLEEVNKDEIDQETAEPVDPPTKAEIFEGEKEAVLTIPSIERAEEDNKEFETEILVTNEEPVVPASEEEKEIVKIEKEMGREKEIEIEREGEGIDKEKEIEREVEGIYMEKEIEREVEAVQEVKEIEREVQGVKEIEREVEVVQEVKETQSVGTTITPKFVEPVLQEKETQKVVEILAPENLNQCIGIEQHTEVQVAGRDLPVGTVQHATWWNCCGVLDVFSGSNR